MKLITWQPTVSFQPQNVPLHWSHVRPTVFGGHTHWPLAASHTLFSPSQPHAEETNTLCGKYVYVAPYCHVYMKPKLQVSKYNIS